MSAFPAIAIFLAGLAFFFHGLDGVKESLKSMAGRSLRQRIERYTSSGALAALWGFILGALAQSSTAASFIVTGFVSSRLLTLRRALTMVAWANLGTVVLPFIASFDIRTAIALILGVGGLLAAFRTGREFLLPAWRGLFMLGLLMMGLQFLKDATGTIPDEPWFRHFATTLGDSLAFGFLVGIASRMVIQSTSAIVVIVVTFVNSGILTEGQAAMMVHGAGVGVGATVLLMGRSSHGLPRQLAYFQAIINSTAGAILALEVITAKLTGLPSVMDLIRTTITSDPSRMLALVYLVQQSLCVAIAEVCGNRWPHWLNQLSPPTDAQNLATPMYIDQGAGVDPASFLDMIGREQARIIDRLPDILDCVRSDGERTMAECNHMAESCKSLGTEIHHALRELSQTRLDRQDAEQLLALDIKQRAVDQLVTEIAHFARAALEERRTSEPGSESNSNGLLFAMTEGLHLVLSQLVECERTRASGDVAMLMMIVGDRGDLMEQLRADIAESTSNGARPGLQYTLALFERAMWLVGKVAPAAPTGADCMPIDMIDPPPADAASDSLQHA
ncbi:MAG: hypothetical protein DWH86_00560 [Planctomycetota bacterium]|nr:MAG: hypothetical protein DWH86_00560 [Planctomycetota bacterium]